MGRQTLRAGLLEALSEGLSCALDTCPGTPKCPACADLHGRAADAVLNRFVIRPRRIW